MLESGHDSLGVGWDEEGWGVGWGEVGWSGVGRSVTWYPMFSPMQLKKRDTYAPKATPSNPRKQMNETLTRWGCAFSRARCRCGAHTILRRQVQWLQRQQRREEVEWMRKACTIRVPCKNKNNREQRDQQATTGNAPCVTHTWCRRPHVNDEMWQQDACVRLRHWPNAE